MQPSERHPRRGLAWMVLAQLFFAGMNVCTRLGSADLPWSEIGAARFVIGALIALAVAKAQRHSLRVTDRAGTWRRSIFGTLAAVGAFFALGSSRIGVGDAATLGATSPTSASCSRTCSPSCSLPPGRAPGKSAAPCW